MIVSFYSYKGGVGRSQLVANLAAYLYYRKQRKILLIDWDIEAPGLDYFFNFKRDNIEAGIIDLFQDYIKLIEEKEDKVAIEDLPKIKDGYINNILRNRRSGSRIDLVASGKYDDKYLKDINDFDWYQFYESYDGKYYIEHLKEQLNSLDYDYVFIDSRTGLNDYSGICNIQMPDVNVIVVAPSLQNFDGALEVVNSIRNSPYVQSKSQKPIVLPVLSRLDMTDNESGRWFGLFRRRFKEHIVDFAKNVGQGLDIPNYAEETIVKEYIENTLLAYKSKISYGETLLFSDDTTDIENTTLEKQFEEIGKLIEGIPELSPNQKRSHNKLINEEIAGNDNVIIRNIPNENERVFREEINQAREVQKEARQLSRRNFIYGIIAVISTLVTGFFGIISSQNVSVRRILFPNPRWRRKILRSKEVPNTYYVGFYMNPKSNILHYVNDQRRTRSTNLDFNSQLLFVEILLKAESEARLNLKDLSLASEKEALKAISDNNYQDAISYIYHSVFQDRKYLASIDTRLDLNKKPNYRHLYLLAGLTLRYGYFEPNETIFAIIESYKDLNTNRDVSIKINSIISTVNDTNSNWHQRWTSPDLRWNSVPLPIPVATN